MDGKEREYLTAHELWSELSDPPELAVSRAVKLLGLLVVRLEANGALSESDVHDLRKSIRGDVPELR